MQISVCMSRFLFSSSFWSPHILWDSFKNQNLYNQVCLVSPGSWQLLWPVWGPVLLISLWLVLLQSADTHWISPLFILLKKPKFKMKKNEQGPGRWSNPSHHGKWGTWSVGDVGDSSRVLPVHRGTELQPKEGGLGRQTVGFGSQVPRCVLGLCWTSQPWVFLIYQVGLYSLTSQGWGEG